MVPLRRFWRFHVLSSSPEKKWNNSTIRSRSQWSPAKQLNQGTFLARLGPTGKLGNHATNTANWAGKSEARRACSTESMPETHNRRLEDSETPLTSNQMKWKRGEWKQAGLTQPRGTHEDANSQHAAGYSQDSVALYILSKNTQVTSPSSPS